MKKIIVAVLVMAVAFTAFAGGAQESQQEEIVSISLGGSTTVEPITISAIEAFEAKNTTYRISYEGQGSSVGVKGALDGTYVLGGASRDLKSAEEEAGAVATPIALDGIAVVVNGGVMVDSLSRLEIARIYTGEITNWSQVGGPDKAIIVINRDEASGTRAAFHELVIKPEFGKEQEFYKDTIVVESNGDMVTKTGATPDSIGYCGFGYIDKAISNGGKTLLIDGVEPSVSNVLSGDYAVSRRLNIISNGEVENGTFAKVFLDFLLSDEGQAIVEDEGFIALP
ncbi:MAG: phosphate ABC transporter substrate-binding protein [Spirochaetales bacterium]|nr:phosphate ABC transporter substrate-binding protein [Spirochaetales bacterium]